VVHIVALLTAATSPSKPRPLNLQKNAHLVKGSANEARSDNS
jgi:hypothetical protein